MAHQRQQLQVQMDQLQVATGAHLKMAVLLMKATIIYLTKYLQNYQQAETLQCH